MFKTYRYVSKNITYKSSSAFPIVSFFQIVKLFICFSKLFFKGVTNISHSKLFVYEIYQPPPPSQAKQQYLRTVVLYSMTSTLGGEGGGSGAAVCTVGVQSDLRSSVISDNVVVLTGSNWTPGRTVSGQKRAAGERVKERRGEGVKW
jgi:hypothetical protein